MSDEKVKKILLVLAIILLIVIGASITCTYLVVGVTSEKQEEKSANVILSEALDKMSELESYNLHYEYNIEKEDVLTKNIVEGDFSNKLFYATFTNTVGDNTLEEERYIKENDLNYEIFSKKENEWTKEEEEIDDTKNINWINFYEVLKNYDTVSQTSENTYSVKINDEVFNKISFELPQISGSVIMQIIIDDGYITKINWNLMPNSAEEEQITKHYLTIDYSSFNQVDVALPSELESL